MNDIHIVRNQVGAFQCDPADVLDKKHEFPGAAALVAKLQPLYDKTPVSQGRRKATALLSKADIQAIHQEYDKLEGAVHTQLNMLQTIAHNYVAHDKPEKAEEVLQVASVIYMMKEAIEQTCRPEMMAAVDR